MDSRFRGNDEYQIPSFPRNREAIVPPHYA
jgi:hypothetical protein